MLRKRLNLVASFGIVAFVSATSAASAQTSPNLGNASTYSILAGTQVTNTGVTTISGDVGISPGAGGGAPDFNHPGFGTVVLGGTMHDADVPAANAVASAFPPTAGNAYDALSAQGCTTTYDPAVFKELAGANLVPGVYCAASGFHLTNGVLTLTGTASDTWVFKSGSDLIITGGAASRIVSPSCNVWWRIVSSATFDANSSLVGNILADTSVTFAANASLAGRAFARTANVTLSSNQITSCVAPGGGSAPGPTPIPSPRPNACATTSPDLFPVKRHTGLFVVGTNATYTLSVFNNGTTPTVPTTVTDRLPTGLTFVSATGPNWSCAASGQVVTCTTSAAVPGNIALTVTPLASAVPGVINTAVVTGGGDCDVTNNSTSDVTLVAAAPIGTPAPVVCATTAPDLFITKTHTDVFVAGANASYSIMLSNRGLASSGPITVIDTLPPGLTYVSTTAVGWTCAAVGQVVTCTTTASVPAGSAFANNITLTVRAGTDAVPSVTNSAAVAGGNDCDLTNNVTADITPVSLPVPVPTLSEWAFIVLALLLAAAGIVSMRRRPTA
jgi:uncharacterized repeat protein (TIGR01451 family)